MIDFQTLLPMLLEERPVDMTEPGWICELKLDGYRLLAQTGEKVMLRTRNGADATRWFPEVTAGLAKLAGGPYIFDGEVCVLDGQGRSDFNRLHDRARRRRWYEGADPVTYCVFDLLVDRGVDISAQPLKMRKAALARALKKAVPGVMLVGHFEGKDGPEIFREAVIPMKLEGLVAKRLESPYTPNTRSPAWVKVKRKGAIPAERFKR